MVKDRRAAALLGKVSKPIGADIDLLKNQNMKSLLTITFFAVFTLLGVAQDVRTNSKTPASKGQEIERKGYQEGQFTVKLKADVGDFSEQSGMVYFNIPSLDDKVQQFAVYKVEKRFKFNPKKARAGLPDLSRIYKFHYSGEQNIHLVVAAFAADPHVEYAEIIPINRTNEVPNDALYDNCQHLPQIMAEEAWEIHKGEDGTEPVVIAIVDSGTEWQDEDLTDNLWQNLAEDADGDGVTIEFIGGEWVLDPDDLNGIDEDDNGYTDDLIGWAFEESNNSGNGSNPDAAPFNDDHGTHCAGIAAGTTNNGVGISSISYNLTYMPVHVSDVTGVFTHAYDGVIYAAENGADIISNSWSGGLISQANQEAINYAHGLGSMIVAAASNDNDDLPRYPAHYIHVISVAAVTPSDVKASFSSYQYSVDIAAPGTSILSTVFNDNYESFNGTSMACPMVAGALGLLKSYHPDWTNEELVHQLVATTDNIDDVNQGFEYLLGTGRLNAFEMLAGTPETPYLKLGFEALMPADDNGNGVNEQGELVTLDFKIRNYMQAYGAEDVAISITSSDPDIMIIDGEGTVNVPADSIFEILDQFQIQVAADASQHLADLTLHFDADIEIPIGASLDFQLLIASGGILVFELEGDETNFSGSFIASKLNSLGYEYIYTNDLPTTLLGFDAVFLSLGNPGENFDQGGPFSLGTLSLQEYTDAGGNIYIETGALIWGSFFGGSDFAAAYAELFGVDTYSDNFTSQPINNLIGNDGTVMEGISFSESKQIHNWYVDDVTPVATAQIPFVMDTYGNTSIMNTGTDYKTFYLGYGLAPLVDNSAINSRNNVLVKILEFFELTLPEAYTLSNFLVDTTSGATNTEFSFTDISIHDPLHEITSWQWDFDNDGVIDSEEQNPTWAYEEVGVYDVQLITTTDGDVDTLTIEEFIVVNSGYLVYDGDFEGADYSGQYIYDYLIANGYEATYQDALPSTLSGFEAVFLSFGNSGSGDTDLDPGMSEILVNYLEGGGYVYIEGGDVLRNDQSDDLLDYFGVSTAGNGPSENAIDSLYGLDEGIMNGMYFASNSQESNESIDIYIDDANGTDAFKESNYSGAVGVQGFIPNAHRTFCFSYALAKLDDGDFPNTKDEFIIRLLNFFDPNNPLQVRNSSNTLECKAYPNPTSTQTTIEYTLLKDSRVILEITDSRGQRISQLINENQPQGKQRINWNAEAFAAGVYFYTILVNDERYTGKIIRLN